MTDEDRVHVAVFSAEAAPFVKVGGLADVIGSLPKELEKLGTRVTLLLPAYQSIRRARFGIRPGRSAAPFEVPMGAEPVSVEVSQAVLPATGVRVFFLGGGDYFRRDGVYDDPVTRKGYPDNAQRFAFYAKAGLELLERLGRRIDVVHCHDSQTALVPALLRTVHRDNPFFKHTGCLFTIHNMAYQGLYDPEALEWAGIDPGEFYPLSPFEFWGKVNFLKIGIEMADLLNTVSSTYAREIQSDPEYGCGLEDLLLRRSDDLYGIVNGIDYDEWDPETDPQIAAHYSVADLSGKAACKTHLLQTMKLPQMKGRVPLLGIISRLADQKGFDLIGDAIDRIMEQDLQLVILGEGQEKYHELFGQMAEAHPEKVAVRLEFNEALARQIEAGADMFLMPSRYEPCGLNQLYSMRYGTVPIVRATGGLADTVSDYDVGSDRGTGFMFEEYSAVQMMNAIQRALVIYADSERWSRLVRLCMAQRWSWERSARRYLELYGKIVERKRGPAQLRG